jgi:DNA-binding transcriptional LysR family regulator
MDLNWLRDFECLARSQNFTRAADERNITQSAFSRRIKALESWVGMPLVNRATYPVQLTEAGQQFLPIAKAAISQLAEARQTLRDSDRGEHRFTRFSVLHTISVHYLAHRIDAFQADMPDLRTRVISDSLSTCCELLMEGAVDIMLCYAHSSVSPTIDETAFASKELMIDQLVPVATAQSVRDHGWALDDPAQDAIPYLAYEHSSFLGMVVDHTIGRKRFTAETVYVDGLVEAVKRRLMAGSGFAWMPETAIQQELASGQVVPVGGDAWRTPLSIVAYANPSQFDRSTGLLWDAL